MRALKADTPDHNIVDRASHDERSTDSYEGALVNRYREDLPNASVVVSQVSQAILTIDTLSGQDTLITADPARDS